MLRVLDLLDRVLGAIGGLFYGPASAAGAALTVLSILLLVLAGVLAWGSGQLGEALGFVALGMGAFFVSAVSNNLD